MVKPFGAKIYALRTAKHITQAELANKLSVTPAAVSKWERDLTAPDIDSLLSIADFFDISLDQLFDRDRKREEAAKREEDGKIQRLITAENILELSRQSRRQGLLTMRDGVAWLKNCNPFLTFSIEYSLQLLAEHTDVDLIKELLFRYVETLEENEQLEGRMIAHGVILIVMGESQELIGEVLASYIGMEYREQIVKGRRVYNKSRNELYKELDNLCKQKLDMLDCFAAIDDFHIQLILRQMNHDELVTALVGTSKAIAVRVLNNVSDRLLPFLIEDMYKYQGTEENIMLAQRKMLEHAIRMQAIEPN
ncbi:MAG: helix-turn-helix domain-containing protein [Lachnospiraceae bacterium]